MPLPDPKQNGWTGRCISTNTMAVNAYSRGIATFDAINEFGKPYDTSNPNIIRYADSLTSQQIDLGGKVAADSIYFSFLYQPAGNGFRTQKKTTP